ncbi:shikimate dehydrogenase [Beijerinckia indica]|uniref:Shikimate dehydrogenase (NADP(+)) n=1 Tax=Beijerinckia indica subsp. indica (strain ATCC 9039 / DSM 1715 / NCIMB 8712) TaxID=395963 RepID=B2IG55_BEII9|nr:shikimate dehydrogenase [Beijerinckia indica]ACB97129.1 shikimate 5-dehydrogenase [Beijerinckia indica subsp. indica ATCC 9039]
MNLLPQDNPGPKVCVIGYPIKHSRSPLIHNYWLQRYGIAGSYEKIEVAPEHLADFLRDLGGKGFVGANVTLPHKETAFALCDEVSEEARQLGAVNTLFLRDGRLHGHNTDGEGFLGALDQEVPAWDKDLGKAVIIGAGGAARALVFALLRRGAGEIALVNRTLARSEEIAMQGGGRITCHSYADLPDVLKTADLLVNATSLGMAGQEPLVIDLSPLPAKAIVDDIVYVPLETDLLRQARLRGLRRVGGLGMLLHQAVPGFRLWFGKTPEVTPELRALIEADIGG